MNNGTDETAIAFDFAALAREFADGRLLAAALTHRSHLNEVHEPDAGDNERLEYLGDALVDFVAADFLYAALPDAREGPLTTLRAALVCEPTLASYARRIDLGSHLRLGRGEESSGARNRDAILGDAFEAVVGAIYLDRGFVAAESFVMRFLVPELEAVLSRRRVRDAKSLFQELAQRAWQTTPTYETVSERGPDHAKWFQVRVRVADEIWGAGEGRSKSDAAQRAADEALERVRSERPDLATDA